jgi:hypothetical protein
MLFIHTVWIKKTSTSAGHAMSDTTALRQQLTAAPARVLARLTAMGEVMVVAHSRAHRCCGADGQ